jgi:hypothetical protein
MVTGVAAWVSEMVLLREVLHAHHQAAHLHNNVCAPVVVCVCRWVCGVPCHHPAAGRGARLPCRSAATHSPQVQEQGAQLWQCAEDECVTLMGFCSPYGSTYLLNRSMLK